MRSALRDTWADVTRAERSSPTRRAWDLADGLWAEVDWLRLLRSASRSAEHRLDDDNVAGLPLGGGW